MNINYDEIEQDECVKQIIVVRNDIIIDVLNNTNGSLVVDDKYRNNDYVLSVNYTPEKEVNVGDIYETLPCGYGANKIGCGDCWGYGKCGFIEDIENELTKALKDTMGINIEAIRKAFEGERKLLNE